MRNNILDILGKKVLLMDGAMGTQLQLRGLNLGEAPESFNLNHPDVIRSIHKAYIDAGADLITTNTFGANRLKLARAGLSVEDVVSAGVRLAKEAAGENGYAVLDIGPLGQLIEPFGTLSFEEAYELFAEQIRVGEAAGADLILVETMTDLGEMRAALIAARECSKLPVFATMSFEAGGRTFMGCSAASAAATLGRLADAVGINCSLGPAEILPIAKIFAETTETPLIFQPNAGIPHTNEAGETVFDVTPADFAEGMQDFYDLGTAVMGGCCGTSPEHIAKVAERFKGKDVTARSVKPQCRACSASTLVNIDGVKVIGERINPTGKKRFKEALLSGDVDYILRQGIEQAEAGADVLDVNVGLPDIDEPAMIRRIVTELQTVTNVPLQIDSSNSEAIEAALRAYHGKAIVNSVNGERKSMDAVLPLVKKYGAAVVALTLDERGIPETVEQRLEIAEKIIKEADKHGIPREDIIVDCLTLTVSAQQKGAAQTLEAIRQVKAKYGVKTALGVSNISFGLPARDHVNEVFLAQALQAGLDLPIINPNSYGMMAVVAAHKALSGEDTNCEEYVEKYANEIQPKTAAAAASDQAAQTEAETAGRTARQAEAAATDAQIQSGDDFAKLREIVVKGFSDSAAAEAENLLQTKEPLEIVDGCLIPALDVVGEKYEKGILFLPQLIRSAETVQAAFEVLRKRLSKSTALNKGTIVLATVKGDIHDIGKNIVKVILENYGYRIVDLGRDVPAEKVLETVQKEDVKLVGLSALMTTTVKSMEETIELLHKEAPQTKIMVGGAVLTKDYADKIKADRYTKDARASVEFARHIFGQ